MFCQPIYVALIGSRFDFFQKVYRFRLVARFAWVVFGDDHFEFRIIHEVVFAETMACLGATIEGVRGGCRDRFSRRGFSEDADAL